MDAKTICLHASLEAKGGTGMVALAGQKLNLVLQDLKLNRDLKVNRVTTTLTLQAGTNGPFNLPLDYLRTYDMFYPLQGPNGMTQFLTPITMEQYDAEFKAAQTANYPYEFATDLSTQAQAASGTASNIGSVASVVVNNAGFGYTAIPVVIPGGGGGSGATFFARMGLALANISAGGAGYVFGDLLSPVGGASTQTAVYIVTTTGGGGSVTGVAVVNPGDYSILPAPFLTPFATTTNAAGAGCTLAFSQGFISSIGVSAGGSGYTSAPTLTIFPLVGHPSATAVLGASSATAGKGQLYIYPQSNGVLSVTHRYMRDQPDIVNPETGTDTPWFAYDAYLIKATAAAMMGITGDARQKEYEAAAEAMLRPHLIMEGDEQQTVRAIKLDPRHFHTNRGLRPTKLNPY